MVPISRLSLLGLALLAVLTACDGGSAGGDGGLAQACRESDLVAQCPLGSNPVAGVQAEASCDLAVGGLVSDAEGRVEAQCQGVAGCRVLCRFAVPCECGVASVSRDGVICASCEGAASCGNNVCEGGESPQNCPIDCGNSCMAGEVRCDGDQLESCNLQGRFDRLPCPSGEVCRVENGITGCVRDDQVIIGGDAGVDGGTRPQDGRLILGNGSLPVIVGHTAADFPTAPRERRVTVQQVTSNGTEIEMTHAMRRVEDVLVGWRLVPGSDDTEALAGLGRLRLGPEDDTVRIYPQPFAEGLVTPERELAYCAHCQRHADAEACEANFWSIQPQSDYWTWFRACITASFDESCDGQVPSTCCPPLDGTVCQPIYVHPYPDDRTFMRDALVLVGNRVLGTKRGAEHMQLADLETGLTYEHTPFGTYRFPRTPRQLALSADGRTAAAIAESGSDNLVVIWEVETGIRRAILPLSVGSWTDLALSPDGQVLALVARNTADPALDLSVSLWNVAEERRIVTIRPLDDGNVLNRHLLEFSPNGNEIALSFGGREVEIWPLAREPMRRHVLDVQPADIQHVRYAPDGHTLALVSTLYHQVSLWDTVSGQRRFDLAGGPEDPNPSVTSIQFTVDGQRLLVVHQIPHRLYSVRVAEP